jgi:hypothetical protein
VLSLSLVVKHISIRPDLWETNFNRALGRSEKASQINNLLDEIKSGTHWLKKLFL